MKKILLFIWPEMGHLLPTFYFAKKLKARGLDVRYACTEQKLVDKIHEQGFNAIHYQSIGDFLGANQGVSIPELLVRRYQQLIDLISDYHPDLILCDTVEQHIVGIALQRGIKIISYTTSLPDRHDWIVFPMSPLFTLLPQWHHPIYTAFSRALWLLVRQLEIQIHPYWKHYHKMILDSMVKANIDVSRVDWKGAWRDRFRGVPEVLLSPQCFDYSRRNLEDIVYDGPNIDFSRGDNHQAVDIDPTKKTIYCALGTQLVRVRDPKKVFGTIIEAFLGKPDWQLIIAVGQEAHADLCRQYQANNLKILAYAPQLSILRLADLAIVHGGLGSIKECLYFGVPMIVLPTGSDQYGNAYLVERHSIGVQSSIKKIESKEMTRLVELVLQNPLYKTKAQEMSAIFQREQEKSVLVEMVEGMLVGTTSEQRV